MNQKKRIITEVPFPEWAQKGLCFYQFSIVSTGKNENDRTQMASYLISGNTVTVFPGEFLDSPSDLMSIAMMAKDMEEYRRDHIMKQARSEQEAARFVLV